VCAYHTLDRCTNKAQTICKEQTSKIVFISLNEAHTYAQNLAIAQTDLEMNNETII